MKCISCTSICNKRFNYYHVQINMKFISSQNILFPTILSCPLLTYTSLKIKYSYKCNNNILLIYKNHNYLKKLSLSYHSLCSFNLFLLFNTYQIILKLQCILMIRSYSSLSNFNSLIKRSLSFFSLTLSQINFSKRIKCSSNFYMLFTKEFLSNLKSSLMMLNRIIPLL